eukprot:scaffold113619_cov18-Prasinocladus_malaysianus.AAC.2
MLGRYLRKSGHPKLPGIHCCVVRLFLAAHLGHLFFEKSFWVMHQTVEFPLPGRYCGHEIGVG